MRAAYLVGFLWLTVLSAPAPRAGEAPLPRRAESRDERYEGVRVSYETVRAGDGARLRLILTRPAASGPWALVFVTGWLSCDSVEVPPGSDDAPQRVFQALARLPGFMTARLDKPGVGDSEGDCAQTDFNSELEDYRRAFRQVTADAHVDPRRIFLFGLSNGAGFAPLVPQGTAVRGYVVIGGWLKTWYEHMLELERRRLVLAGHASAEINPLMQQVAALYSAYLLEGESPAHLFARQPALQALWEGAPTQQYGRPVAYYQQLQALNLLSAWSQVRVPLLALHGEFDWIMSRADLETMAALVNANVPGSAEFVELPATGHTFEHYSSAAQAFRGSADAFDPALARRVTDWLQRQP